MTFDEQPDGDPHGECAAEIARLTSENERFRYALNYALVGLLEADAYFTEYGEGCLGVAHALPKVREALDPRPHVDQEG